MALLHGNLAFSWSMNPSFLVMPRADAAKWSSAAYRQQMFDLVDRGVGGVAVFLGTLADTATMIADLQRRAKEPLLIAADYEHGLPMRLDGGVAFPRAMALGQTSPETTEGVAAAIAEECVALGVHWNFAPVCDVNSDPLNPIINTRSFGEDATTVGRHAAAYIRGTQSQHVLACAKHAPGHGDTRVDSHVALPTITVDRSTAEQREFVPFRDAIAAGVRSMMIAHIVVPFLDADLPASLSPATVTGLVREAWGFDGLISTDALDMSAISAGYTSGEAAVRAVLAGNDVILLPEDPQAALDALDAAVASGEISQERLAASHRRWQEAKQWCGLFERTHDVVAVDQNAHATIALRAASEAIRVEGNADLLPITQFDHVAVFAVINEADADAATTWFHYMAQATELNIDFGFIDGTIEDEDLAELKKGTSDAKAMVFTFFGKAVAYRGSMPGFDRLDMVMTSLADGRPIITVACGSPYGIKDLPSSATLYTFSDTVPSMAASVLRLTGKSVT